VIIRFPSDQRDDLVENYGERFEDWIKSMVDPEFPILPHWNIVNGRREFPIIGKIKFPRPIVLLCANPDSEF
jgi:hypothetical protein